jgi:hypothetical protein
MFVHFVVRMFLQITMESPRIVNAYLTMDNATIHRQNHCKHDTFHTKKNPFVLTHK